MDISTENLELLCELDVDDIDEGGYDYHQEQLDTLATIFEEGGADTSSDRYKAKKFRNKMLINQQILTLPLIRTSNLYNLFGWYTAIRIVFVSIFNLIESMLVILKGITVIPLLVKHQIFGVAGLSYGVELLVDIAMVIKAVFFPAGRYENELPWWKRLNNILRKGDRVSRMLNAGVWFAVNFSIFLITGGLWSFTMNGITVIAGAIGLFGFVFDFFHVLISKGLYINKLKRLARDVNNRILFLQSIERKTSDEKNELAWLSTRVNALDEKIEKVKSESKVALAIASLFFIGIGLLFIPSVLSGASATFMTILTLTGGSIFVIASLSLLYVRIIGLISPTKPRIPGHRYQALRDNRSEEDLTPNERKPSIRHRTGDRFGRENVSSAIRFPPINAIPSVASRDLDTPKAGLGPHLPRK